MKGEVFVYHIGPEIDSVENTVKDLIFDASKKSQLNREYVQLKRVVFLWYVVHRMKSRLNFEDTIDDQV
jgi:hypothetical protein